MFTVALENGQLLVLLLEALDDSAGFASLFTGNRSYESRRNTACSKYPTRKVTLGAEGHTSDMTVSISGGLGAGVSDVYIEIFG